jgi:hypothetical protein
MYPQNFVSLFPPFPRNNKVFVAMSFDERLTSRWQNVIRPAIEMVRLGDRPLQSVRVDAGKVSDSILTEILDGISTSRIIFVDVTALDFVNGRPVRNANVLYELGIAHATRLAEEVIIVRSDTAPLFDLANVRVNTYEPDTQPDAARDFIAGSIVSAIKEIRLRQHLSVQRAVDSLDFDSWMTLCDAVRFLSVASPQALSSWTLKGWVDARAIRHLLDIGALRATYPQPCEAYLDKTTGEI